MESDPTHFASNFKTKKSRENSGKSSQIQENLRNQGVLGTVWNAWQEQWSGVVDTTYGNTFVDYTTERGFGRGGKIADTKQRVTQTTRTDLTRTGLHTAVVENIEEESQGKRVIARALIPFVRPRTLTVTGECFRPGIRLYAFFDGRDMSNFITPSTTEFSSDASPVEGSPLITNGAGTVKCTFRIPEYRFAGQASVPRFRTGELEFRLTSSPTNKRRRILPLSAGETTYKAVGILETEQETIIATRNAEIVRTTVNDETSRTDQTNFDRLVGTQITRQEEEDRPDRDPSKGTLVQFDLAGSKTGAKVRLFKTRSCDGRDPLAH